MRLDRLRWIWPAFLLVELGLSEGGVANPHAQNNPDPCHSLPYSKATLIARGNEPGWTASFTCPDLLVTRSEAQRQQQWRLPLAATLNGTDIFSTRDQTIQWRVKPAICRDTMTGMPYPFAVVLKIKFQTMKGCGGDPLELIAGQYWRVVAIDEQPLNDPTAIWFTVDEMGELQGSTRCFRFRSRLVVGGESIHFEPVFTTIPSCSAENMTQTLNVLFDLPLVSRFDLDEGGTLLLNGEGRTLLRALPLPSGG